MGCCIALDIGGTKIAAALIDNHGNLRERQQVATPRDGATPLLHALQQLIVPWRSQATSVAVASTGIIRHGQLIALNPANLGGMVDFPLEEAIREISGLPCTLLNDAQAGAWAEYQALEKSVNNMAFITVSTGVGGGIVLNNVLQTGSNGLSGHIGHTLADPNGPLCGCGRRGCVESIASGTAIAAATADWQQPLSTKQIFSEAQQGIPEAMRLVERSASAIAQLIADLVMTLDIERVVLGGSVGLAEGYQQQVLAALQTFPALCQVPVQSAHHQQDSGLIGAAAWATVHSSF